MTNVDVASGLPSPQGSESVSVHETSQSSEYDSENEEDDEPRWWKACERCGADRKLQIYPHGFWYCEMNPDPSAPRCEPTALCPLRASRGVQKASIGVDLSIEHVNEMLDVFQQLKQAGTEQDVTLASGWVATYKKRKRGETGDAYITRAGEPTLRSAADVRRRFGLPATASST